MDTIIDGKERDKIYKEMQRASTSPEKRNELLIELIDDDEWRLVERLIEKDYTPIKVNEDVLQAIIRSGEENWDYVSKLLRQTHKGHTQVKGKVDIETDSGYDWGLIKCFIDQEIIEGVEYWHEQGGPLRAWELYQATETISSPEIFEYLLKNETFSEAQLAKAFVKLFDAFLEKGQDQTGLIQIGREGYGERMETALKTMLRQNLPLQSEQYADRLNELNQCIDPFSDRWPGQPAALPVLLLETQYALTSAPGTIDNPVFSIFVDSIVDQDLVLQCMEEGVVDNPWYFQKWTLENHGLIEGRTLFEHLHDHNLHPPPSAIKEHGAENAYRPLLSGRERRILEMN